MKVFLSVLLLALLSLAGVAAEAQKTISVGYERDVLPGRDMPLNLRHRSQSELPRVLAGLQVESYAKTPAEIKGMAVRPNGEILLLDGERGQIIILSDRDKDGRLDMTRKMPARFSGAVSMAIVEEDIYVVDARAVWEVSTSGQRVLASLENIDALPDNRPLIAAPQAQFLYLGLTRKDGTSLVVSIDRTSGAAAQIAEGEGEITTLAQTKGSPLWLGMDNQLVPVSSSKNYDKSRRVEFPDHISVQKVYLPTSESLSGQGLSSLNGKFLISLGQDLSMPEAEISGRQILALNSSFGQPDGLPVSIVSGFLRNHGRAAWGEPKHMVWDERGLFFADTQSGTIWRVSRLKPKFRIVERPKAPVKFYESDEVKKPKAQWGSSISQGSKIVSGSELSRDWAESKLIPKETYMEKLRRSEEEGEDTKKDDD